MELNVNKLLKVIKLASQILLENGGEIYRVEETIKYICRSFDIKEADSIATPTGIYITISVDDTNNYTIVKRINKRSINLEKLNIVNSISRNLTNHSITLDEALVQLENIRNDTDSHKKISMLYGGISAGFFTLMFGGGILEFLISLVSGITVTVIVKNFESLHSYQFFSSILGGIIISSFAIIITYICGFGNYNYVIVGGIMPQLPGLSMTNAIRDTIRGDLISGMARAAEATLIAASLAAGAGVVISLSYTLGILH